MLRLILCEFATGHQDGTFTIVRGGIEHIDTPSLPTIVQLYVLAEAEPNTLGGGAVQLELRVEFAGTAVAVVQGFGLAVDPKRVARFCLPVQVPAAAYGSYVYSVKVGTEVGSTTLEVRPPSAPASVAPPSAS